ncbi:MAG: amidohydrolase family protein [Deltaproteobacteria bacterium]|nr:amidohydrolase family protein [Deltaproteobacteria bacterium]
MPTMDADAHVIECEQTWSYIKDEKLRPYLVTPGGSRPQNWLIDGRVFHRGVNLNRSLPLDICEMRDIEGRLKHMDQLNIDIQVLYPSLFLRPLTAEAEVEGAICRSYNQWLVDICSRGERRLHWVAVVPVIDINAAVSEVQYAKANGACGIFMRGLIDDKRLSHPYFFPIYESAEKANLPICVHASTGNFDWMKLFDGESGFMRFKAPVLSAFHAIVHDGVPQKFPRLRFGFIEVRAQWVPYMAVEIARRLSPADNSFARNLIRDNHVFVACQTDDDLPYVLKYAGEDNIVIGSDYGHNDTSSEIEALRTIKKKGDVDAKVIDKILYDNAKALYGI